MSEVVVTVTVTVDGQPVCTERVPAQLGTTRREVGCMYSFDGVACAIELDYSANIRILDKWAGAAPTFTF